jgi:hypothetical protein
MGENTIYLLKVSGVMQANFILILWKGRLFSLGIKSRYWKKQSDIKKATFKAQYYKPSIDLLKT